MKKLMFLFIVLLTMSCSTYTVHKNTHRSVPFQFYQTRGEISGKVTIGEDWRYKFNDKDQYDWNKLTGAKYYYFKPHEETMMLGWRYNPEFDHIEIIPYQHREGITYMWDDTVHIYPIGDTINFRIVHSPKYWYVYLDDIKYTIEHTYIEGKKVKRIVHWFGGTKSAPHKISMSFQWVK